MTEKPDLGFWKLWNLSFGFFGVQIAYALQSSQVSRIFSTIGADPKQLSFFWILPPLMGLIIQPIIGTVSDRTWNRFGRRLPYLLLGAVIAMIVMCLLPNSGSLGLSLKPVLFGMSWAIIFGLIMLMLLDTSINMAMQPFKMLVGDFVNERQKSKAYSIQSFLCNAGSVVGYIAPIMLGWFLSKTAPEGVVPPTVTWAFYLGAAILAVCVVYTFVKVKEMPPAEYAAYHGITPARNDEKESANWIELLKKAPKVFWTVGLVQFFCWAAFLFMWTYSTDAIANQVFHAPASQRFAGIEVKGVQYTDNYVFNGNTLVIENGELKTDLASLDKSLGLDLAHMATLDNGEYILGEQKHVVLGEEDVIVPVSKVKLIASSAEYQDAGDWNGVLLAIQGLAAVLWALALGQFKNRKLAYMLSLLIGAAGFVSVMFVTDKYVLLISYALMGCAWAAMLAMPFTILTNALNGKHIGAYLGLFNCTITVPQIVAAVCGGLILGLFPLAPNGTDNSVMMLVCSGILLVLGAIFVLGIRETFGERENASQIADDMMATQMSTDADI